jgi:2-(1,2-epoxy-1,2-dihydrophenyl)acetyl-CoA isomerase
LLTVTLNRPERFNALNSAMTQALLAACDQAAQDDTIRALLINAAGNGFCAGQDLREMPLQEGKISFSTHLEAGFNRLVMALRTLEKPVIAAINGVCAGAGLGLALAADIRLASDRASFLPAFSGIGLAPDSGVSWWLPRLIGPARAADLLLTNTPLAAAEALASGLVSRLVPHDQLGEVSLALALKLAAGPTRALGLTKRALNRGLHSSLEEALAYEGVLQDQAGESADFIEGVTAFLQKRPPRFSGT